MTVTKSGVFPIANSSGVVNDNSVLDAIKNMFLSLGLSPFAERRTGTFLLVYAIPFSGAARGTVYFEIQNRLFNSGSDAQYVFRISCHTAYNAATFTGTGSTITRDVVSYRVLTNREAQIQAFYKPEELCLIQTTAGGGGGVCSPITKPVWWNEDLFCHAFLLRFGETYELDGILRGTNPNFFNPFPDTTSDGAVTVQDAPAWDRNPLNQYDVFTQPLCRWTGLRNYGWVGRFSNDIGWTAPRDLVAGQRLTLSETEVYEVVHVSSSRASVLRVV